MRTEAFNASAAFGIGKARTFLQGALLVRVQGPLVEGPVAPSLTEMVSSEPSEVLPTVTAEAEYEATPTEEAMYLTPVPSIEQDAFDATPELTMVTIDASPILPSDEQDGSFPSPELMLEPEPSSTFEVQQTEVLPSPESFYEPSPSSDPVGTPLHMPDISDPSATPELLTEPAPTPSALSTTATPEALLESSDGTASGSAADPTLSSSIEGLKSGAERVGVAVASLIGVVSVLVVALIGVVVGTRTRYLPFVAGTSVSGSSNDFVVPHRSRPDRMARVQDEGTAPWRYEARSLDTFEYGP